MSERTNRRPPLVGAPDPRRCDILHVDMDAFFASVEVLDDPTLSGKPVIVGGAGSRGVVASCTYEARAFGIHSAMASAEARRRCPHAVFLPGRYERYTQTSEQLHSILLRYTPLVEGVALDEAFLDVAGATHLFGAAEQIAWAIRSTVADELGLRCCVGVARTKLLAKLASRAAKPTTTPRGVKPGRGVIVVDPGEELAFLHPLPVRALWGVGPATGRRLANLGVVTVGDLASMPDETIERALGTANGRHLASLARGEDDRAVQPARDVKSVGHEETFASDLLGHARLHREVMKMADAVACRLREAGLEGRTVTLKVRYGDRRTITRSQTLANPHDSVRVVSMVAAALLDATDVSPGVRLIGVSVSSLTKRSAHAQQLSFDPFDPPGVADTAGSARGGAEGAARSRAAVLAHGSSREGAWEEVADAVSQIRARYGRSSLSSAALAGPDGISVKHRGDTQWGPSDESRP